jgi:hypothetical protein
MAIQNDAHATGLGHDQPIKVNELGAKQSAIPHRCDLLPPLALLHEAKILAAGAVKYGVGNWKRIPVPDHLNHALTHLLAFLAGNAEDDHLGHATCRLLFALELQLEGGK